MERLSDGRTSKRCAERACFLKIEISGLPPGKWVSLHVHEMGACDPADHFKSAGGDFDPGHRSHGVRNSTGYHAGDLPNQYVGADGVLGSELIEGNLALDRGKAGIRGRTIVIQAHPDDYESQPAGNSGERSACAVIP